MCGNGSCTSGEAHDVPLPVAPLPPDAAAEADTVVDNTDAAAAAAALATAAAADAPTGVRRTVGLGRVGATLPPAMSIRQRNCVLKLAVRRKIL